MPKNGSNTGTFDPELAFGWHGGDAEHMAAGMRKFGLGTKVRYQGSNAADANSMKYNSKSIPTYRKQVQLKNFRALSSSRRVVHHMAPRKTGANPQD